MEFKALVNRIRWIVYIVYATATIGFLYLIKLGVVWYVDLASLPAMIFTSCLIIFSIVGGIIHFYKNTATVIINILLIVFMTFQILDYYADLRRRYDRKYNERLRSGQPAPIDSISTYSNIIGDPGTPKFYTDSVPPTAPYAGGSN